ncbi:uncharacterized protein LOC574686 [Strongylocentrotus purpuratus]|uniref:Sushi domain-containing protein n=1 Tax=Strongylocentrotus purpuratus TaxID=7668 RepID=A0A7M7HPR0_STRPU|nr:uncharacterized protein LOC574686 [Strongylocentrotus purpuratus]|eukprot:XP_011679967.1 PREDICTED: uncharacterized protein LOC574686 [Strongylocentrotus purpuratus]
MLENISNLVLVVCLATSVAGLPQPRGIIWPPGRRGGRASGGPAGRIKRQFNINQDSDPYGQCGEPSMPIAHGGIKLFPITDFDDIYDNSCNNYGGQSNFLMCQPKFYCNEGYEVKGNVDLECVENEATGVYKWEGDIPTCVTEQFSGYLIICIVVPVVLVVSIISAMIRRRSVRSRSTQRRCVSRTTIVIPPSSTVPTGRSILSGGPPPYERFDDSNINVPREGTILSTGTTPNTQAK